MRVFFLPKQDFEIQLYPDLSAYTGIPTNSSLEADVICINDDLKESTILLGFKKISFYCFL